MTIKNVLLTLVVFCMVAPDAPAQRRSNSRAGILVNTGKPAVYISFLRVADLEPLRASDGRKHFLFRITNNTRWEMWLKMGGVPEGYGDANLFYTIEGEEKGEIRIDSRCHVCSVNPVGAGRSVVFSIPADYASRDARLRLEYSFAWELANEIEGGSYSVHSVLFYFSYLPKAVLPITALSSSSLNRTRNELVFYHRH